MPRGCIILIVGVFQAPLHHFNSQFTQYSTESAVVVVAVAERVDSVQFSPLTWGGGTAGKSEFVVERGI